MLTRAVYLSALASLAAAHGLITAVQGGNGVVGAGMGVDPSTPRDGVTAKPYQQDTSIIRDSEIMTGKVGPCGRTKQRGAIDINAEMAAATAAGLPSVSPNGEIQMTLHQVNQDGAGYVQPAQTICVSNTLLLFSPYTCDVSADGGKTFQSARVTKNIVGIPLVGLSLAAAKDFPLNVQMPGGMKCAGGPNGDACIVRCRNTTPAGPFGSCVVFTDQQGYYVPSGSPQKTTSGAGKSAQAVTPAGVLGIVPAAAADALPPIIPDAAATVLNGATKLIGFGRRATPPDNVNPLAIVGAVPAAIADAIPPIVPDTAATVLNGLTSIVGLRRATPADAVTPAGIIGAVPAAIADIIPPIVPDTAATVLDSITKLIPIKKRALAGPEEFAAQDAEDAKLEDKLIADLKQGKVAGGKRVIRSRIAGSLSGQLI
ncbi:hypothetical protein FRC12_001214 [Ceratobasidium sp. 428]|nr:hypothetical protein FRC12_001214 [Ceratobasidium sp. 428]